MDNLTAAKFLCNAICSTFYPDANTVRLALFNADIDADADASAKDPAILRVAARLVMGYVEGSRSEGGVSASVRSEEAVRQSIRVWCKDYGIEEDEVMGDCLRAIDDISDLW